MRGYGDFYHYHLLAAGKLDAVIESDVNILDIAALSLIVEEAGGRFTDLDGKPWAWRRRPCWPATGICTTHSWNACAKSKYCRTRAPGRRPARGSGRDQGHSGTARESVHGGLREKHPCFSTLPE